MNSTLISNIDIINKGLILITIVTTIFGIVIIYINYVISL